MRCRSRVCACSSTTEISRFHITCRVMTSSPSLFAIARPLTPVFPARYCPPARSWPGRPARRRSSSALPTISAGAVERASGAERRAPVERGLHRLAARPVVKLPPAGRGRGGRGARLALGRRQALLGRDGEAPGQHLDIGARNGAPEQPLIVPVVGRLQRRPVGGAESVGRHPSRRSRAPGPDSAYRRRAARSAARRTRPIPPPRGLPGASRP